MPAHNNVLPNAHFHKRWMDRVKTWFNQPARKHRRRMARAAKAEKVAPRPTGGLLRPIVRAPTVRYNMKQRKGRGFTFEELKEAGISKLVARSVGIAVDHRRKNHSVESLQENVQRLKTYHSKLVIFPGRGNLLGLKAVDKSEIGAVTQVKGDALPMHTAAAPLQYAAVKTNDESVFHQMRVLKSDLRLVGQREKKRKEKIEEAAQAAKAGK
jgi:large subunit ribosomal protein L13e